MAATDPPTSPQPKCPIHRVAAGSSFSTASVSLTTARSNHQAFLPPHNGGTLIVGSTAAGTAISSAELYMPLYLSHTQTSTLTPTKPMNSARA